MYQKESCLWHTLQDINMPIVMYGTGNGADKILDACEKYRIKISGVFASSSFVRNRSFRGMKVESLESLEERLGERLCVLLCFGTTRPEVTEQIRAVAGRHLMYIPDVPLYGGELFDLDFYKKHEQSICDARALMSDTRSVSVFDDMISFRLSGEGRFLKDTQSSADSYREFLTGQHGVCVDCGAFTGDSTAEIAEILHPSKIIAAEPDMGTFKKLSAYAENEKSCTVEAVRAAVGESCGEVSFVSAASRSSGEASAAKRSKTVTVPKVSVDHLCGGQRVSFIKYDVEGAEREALEGSLETIRSCAPSLCVSLYHRSADIFELPLFLHDSCGYDRFYLRRVPCIPAWDLMLFAFKGQRS